MPKRYFTIKAFDGEIFRPQLRVLILPDIVLFTLVFDGHRFGRWETLVHQVEIGLRVGKGMKRVGREHTIEFSLQYHGTTSYGWNSSSHFSLQNQYHSSFSGTKRLSPEGLQRHHHQEVVHNKSDGKSVPTLRTTMQDHLLLICSQFNVYWPERASIGVIIYPRLLVRLWRLF